jgi:DNA-binding transcriptional regulator YbjK
MGRMKPIERKKIILQAAITLSIRNGYMNITRDQVADFACISHGLVNRYFTDMDTLRTAIMCYGIEHRVHPLIAQGIVNCDKYLIKHCPDEVKREALKHYLDE